MHTHTHTNKEREREHLRSAESSVGVNSTRIKEHCSQGILMHTATSCLHIQTGRPGPPGVQFSRSRSSECRHVIVDPGPQPPEMAVRLFCQRSVVTCKDCAKISRRGCCETSQRVMSLLKVPRNEDRGKRHDSRPHVYNVGQV